ncbi:MAG: glycosyltransferase family 4 protein [Phycisphaerae bacterium]
MTPWLYVCNDLGIPLDGTKGASEHVRAITRALADTGVALSVVAARGRLPDDHPARQIETGFGRAARESAELLRVWAEAGGAGGGLGSDVGQMLYDARLAAGLAAGEPDAGAARVVVERLSLFCTAARRWARSRGAAYLVEMNAPMAEESARFRDSGLRSLALEVERQTLLAADRVMTVSAPLRDHVIESVGVSPERVVVVPNGVQRELFARAPERAAARAEAGVPGEALVIGFVGSLKVWHGVELLLVAFAAARRELPGAHLLVVGEGKLLEHYRARAAGLGLARHVTFFGGAEHARVPRLLAAMDLAVAPYLPLESFYFSPLKLYEYLAAGLPVVASRLGQITEVITDGREGLLVTPGDAGELAAALSRLGRDPLLRRQMGGVARPVGLRRGWEDVAAEIRALADEAVRAPIAAQEASHAA